jgi:lipid II:glycine glycyltransferase (peptidoglycan interpeptide bridge formation enzyme)
VKILERFWETKEWVNYLLNSKFENIYTDHSFYFKNQYVPLLQSGEEFYSPGFEDDKHLLEEIRQKAQKLNIKRIQVDSQIKSYLAINGYTCILDLNDIHPSKGHKAAIKKAEKHLTRNMYFSVKSCRHDFKADYFRIAGKATRPDESFELLDKWLNRGWATLFVAKYDGKIAGYIYILHYDSWSYYFMGCTEPEYKGLNVSHFLIWEAIKALQSNGIRYLEMGDQPQNSLYECPTEKEKNIAVFKRGFGGQIVVKPRSEYFFDAGYLRETYDKRISEYIRSEYNEQSGVVLP